MAAEAGVVGGELCVLDFLGEVICQGDLQVERFWWCVLVGNFEDAGGAVCFGEFEVLIAFAGERFQLAPAAVVLFQGRRYRLTDVHGRIVNEILV